MRSKSVFFLFWALAGVACGQIEAGESLPGLEMKVPDGASVRLAVEKGQVTVFRAGRVDRPRAVMVHFFQPDCLQCQAQLRAMSVLDRELRGKDAMIVGAAHRGDLEAVGKIQSSLGLEFPVGLLSSKAGLEKLLAGDACAIVDQAGVARFAQAGFGEGDQVIWKRVFDALLAGQPSPQATVARDRLKAGDLFPAVTLPSLRTGRAMDLTGADGRLRFTDDDGKTTRPRAALFFFSRY